MLATLKASIKQAILPAGPRYRKILLGPAAGCVMQIDFHHNMKHFLGLYEIEVSRHLRRLVRPGDRCFDVGGQGGYDALIMAKRTGREVVSFECEPEAARVMRETFALNPAYSIRTAETFVSGVDDDRQMTLDRAAREFFTPDFVKRDIEGAESDALRGASDLLSGRNPSLIVEVHDVENERTCLEILRDAGSAPEILDQRTWLKDYRPLEHNRWLICPGRDLRSAG